MNRYLADLLADLNLVLAVAIVILGGLGGFGYARETGDNLTFGVGIGLIVGVIVAAILCGLLAMLALIERHLRLIADDVEQMRHRDAAAGAARTE